MSDFLVSFLAAILTEEGAPNPVALATRAAAALRQAGMMSDRRLETAELHRKIDELSKRGMTTVAISVRLGMKRGSVANILTEIHKAKRSL